MTKAFQFATLLVFAATVSAAAQRRAQQPVRAPHGKGAPSANKQTAETRGAESAEHLKSFRGIAAKLNTTPEALQSAYEQAKAANPKLTRGRFIAANMLGQNLSDKGVTTDKILAGLASGKSVGQTLHDLGLSEKEAKQAEKAADREVRDADKAADKAAKAAEKAAKAQAKQQDTKSQAKPDSGH